MNDVYIALNDEILESLQHISKLQPGSEERTKAVKELTMLCEALTNEHRALNDSTKIENERSKDVKLIFTDIGKTAVRIAFDLGAMVVLYKIEKEGYVSFTASKNFFRKFLSK